MATLRSGVFIGRQQEMGKLKAILEDAFSGQGRLVMLAGEPGIGKTRTAQELASRAEASGARVLWGWCYEAGRHQLLFVLPLNETAISV
jgi:Cdc6-like AAA superfamily ATPase